MPVELTPEEKAKFEEVLKERGFTDENSKTMIERLGKEAKTHREAKETLEKEHVTTKTELETLRTEKVEREKAQKAIDDENARKAKEIDDAKKTIDQRLADLQKETEGKISEATAIQKKEMEKLEKQIKDRDALISKRDGAILLRSAKLIADKAGIIDTDLVQYIDFKDVKVEDGEPDIAAIEKIIEEHAKAKPKLYKTAEELAREERAGDRVASAFTGRPGAQRETSRGTTDFSKLDDAAFDAAEAQLRGVRA